VVKELDVTPITEQLLIGAWPRGEHAAALGDMGVRLVLWMQVERPDIALGADPLRLLYLGAWDTPLTFVGVADLRQGVEMALPVLAAGDKVLAVCKSGRRRSAAMIAAILIAQGYAAGDAMALVKARRPVAQPDRWWVRRRLGQFERAWRARS
jgi:hypothetical protein